MFITPKGICLAEYSYDENMWPSLPCDPAGCSLDYFNGLFIAPARQPETDIFFRSLRLQMIKKMSELAPRSFEEIRVQSNLLKLFQHYVNRRTQRVPVKGKCSSWGDIMVVRSLPGKSTGTSTVLDIH